MKRMSALAVGLFMVSGSGWAAMYKCDDPATGRPIYSQTPCAPDAQVMELKIHRPTPEQVRQHEAQLESERRLIEESRARRKASQEPSQSQTPRDTPPPPQSGKPAES